MRWSGVWPRVPFSSASLAPPVVVTVLLKMLLLLLLPELLLLLLLPPVDVPLLPLVPVRGAISRLRLRLAVADARCS